MIAKVIRVATDRNRVAGFLRAQEIWNTESRKSPGYLGEFVAVDLDGLPLVMAFWSSLEAYEVWMRHEHDRIAALAGSEKHYDRISVTIVE